MTSASAPDPVANRLAHAYTEHKAGRLAAAVDIYTEILAHDPNQPYALHLLGEIAHRTGMNERAVRLIERAIQLNPGHAESHNNLGAAYQAQGNLDRAETSYRNALRLDPTLSVARNNLGTVLKAQGRRDDARREFEKALALDANCVEARLNIGNSLREANDWPGAESWYRHTTQLHPDCAAAWNNLGITLLALLRTKEALDVLNRSVELDPRSAEAHNNLGNALRELDRIEEALEQYQQALAIRPHYAEAAYNLSIALASRFKFKEAIPFLRQAIADDPQFTDALISLGACLRNLDQLTEAVECFERAVALEPSHANAHNSRGLTLLEMGRIDEGLAACQTAMRLKDGFASAHNNYLFGLNYCVGITGERLLAAHREFETSDRLPSSRSFANARDPERRLRIGYVSPDFKRHSCAFFIEPLLRSHDQSLVDVFCYADVAVPDAVTTRLKILSNTWRDTSKLSNEALIDTVISDQVDIAIDLTGHTGNNRLLAFSKRLAPIQIAWLGYPCTTGLRAMDYRITDEFADPIGLTDSHYTERLIRLPRTFLCYLPPAEASQLAPAPAVSGTPFTFGSFNNFPKMNAQVLATWAEILSQLPMARLILKGRSFIDRSICDRVIREFEHLGIAPSRIDLIGWIGDPADHFKLYNKIDLALDPFPYAGTTTTCEALWMGVPVLTIAGTRHAARVGVSLLKQVGLDPFIANSPADYVERAVAFAQAPEMLGNIRGTLRARMENSPLRDERAFAHDIEAAYRAVWRDWCAR